MTIAVDIRSGEANPDDYKHFFSQLFQRLAPLHPQHRFIFFINKLPVDAPVFSHNVLPFVISSGTSFFSSLRRSIAVAKALKKYNADVFAGYSNLSSLMCSKTLIILASEADNPGTLAGQQHRWYHKKVRNLCLRKAKMIAVACSFLKKQLVNNYKILPEQIAVTGIAVSEAFKPMDWQQKQAIKDDYTNGCDYFLFPAGRQHPGFIDLLKAFSVFKKWQRSNMKLLITGNQSNQSHKAQDKLANYKYRNEVVTADFDEATLANVTAAPYALVFPGNGEGSPFPIAQAVQCGVPVITSAGSGMAEIAGEAAMYAESNSAADIAEQMKRMYKDEAARSQLVKAAAKQAELLDWQAATAKIWKALEQVVSK